MTYIDRKYELFVDMISYLDFIENEIHGSIFTFQNAPFSLSPSSSPSFAIFYLDTLCIYQPSIGDTDNMMESTSPYVERGIDSNPHSCLLQTGINSNHLRSVLFTLQFVNRHEIEPCKCFVTNYAISICQIF